MPLSRTPNPLSPSALSRLMHQKFEDLDDLAHGYIENDRTRRLLYELRRYCRGEQDGVSILVSGPRGAGKTFLADLAIQKLIVEYLDPSRTNGAPADGRYGMRIPLPIMLHGPTLLDIYHDMSWARAPKDQGELLVKGKDGKQETALVRAAVKRRALIGITTALYRAVCDAVVCAWEHDSVEHTGTGDETAVTSDAELRAELARQLRDSPDAAELRRFWRRAGVLASGVLPRLYRHGPERGRWPKDQGVRELAAVAAVASNYLSILGQIKETSNRARVSEEGKTQKLNAQWMANEQKAASEATPGVAKAITNAAPGLAFAAAAFSSSGHGIVTGLLAWAVTQVSVILGQWTQKIEWSSSRKRSEERKLSIDIDWSPSRLEREMPAMLRLVRDAGLAPIFLIDELDKLDNVFDDLHPFLLVSKHLVHSEAAFIFFANRDYAAELEAAIRPRFIDPVTPPPPPHPEPMPPDGPGARIEAMKVEIQITVNGEQKITIDSASLGKMDKKSDIATNIQLPMVAKHQDAVQTYYEHRLNLFYEPDDYRNFFLTAFLDQFGVAVPSWDGIKNAGTISFLAQFGETARSRTKLPASWLLKREAWKSANHLVWYASNSKMERISQYLVDRLANGDTRFIPARQHYGCPDGRMVLEPKEGLAFIGVTKARMDDLTALSTIAVLRGKLRTSTFNAAINRLIDERQMLNPKFLKPGYVAATPGPRQQALFQITAELVAAKANVGDRIDRSPGDAQLIYDTLYYLADRLDAIGASLPDYDITVSPLDLRVYLAQKLSITPPFDGVVMPNLDSQQRSEPASLFWSFVSDVTLAMLFDLLKQQAGLLAKPMEIGTLPEKSADDGTGNETQELTYDWSDQFNDVARSLQDSLPILRIGKQTRDHALTLRFLADNYGGRLNAEGGLLVRRDQAIPAAASLTSLVTNLGGITVLTWLRRLPNLGVLPESDRLADAGSRLDPKMNGEELREALPAIEELLTAAAPILPAFERALRLARLLSLVSDLSVLDALGQLAGRGLFDGGPDIMAARLETLLAVKPRGTRLQALLTPTLSLTAETEMPGIAASLDAINAITQPTPTPTEAAGLTSEARAFLAEAQKSFWLQWRWTRAAKSIRRIAPGGLSLVDLVFAAAHPDLPTLPPDDLTPALGRWTRLAAYPGQLSKAALGCIETALGLETLSAERPLLVIVTQGPMSPPAEWSPSPATPAIVLNPDDSQVVTRLGDLLGRRGHPSELESADTDNREELPWVRAVDVSDNRDPSLERTRSRLGWRLSSPLNTLYFVDTREKLKGFEEDVAVASNLADLYARAVPNAAPSKLKRRPLQKR